MLYYTNTILLSALLFTGIIIFFFLGEKISGYQKRKNPETEQTGIGPFEGALLGLLSLLLAFTFNEASSFYNTRRSLLVEETNSIGTALMLSDLYPDSTRVAFRNDFKDYISERIRYYEAAGNEGKVQGATQRSHLIAQKIWNRTAREANKSGDAKSLQMVQAVNSMTDVASLREEARVAHVPDSILWLLFTLCMTGSFIVGYANKSKKRDWIILCSYSLMTVMTVYIILDLDQPNKGIINTDLSHENMYQLLNSIK